MGVKAARIKANELPKGIRDMAPGDERRRAIARYRNLPESGGEESRELPLRKEAAADSGGISEAWVRESLLTFAFPNGKLAGGRVAEVARKYGKTEEEVMRARSDPAVRAAVRELIHTRYQDLLGEFIETVAEKAKTNPQYARLFAEMSQEVGRFARPHDVVPVQRPTPVKIDARGSSINVVGNEAALRELGKMAAAFREPKQAEVSEEAAQ